MLRGFGLKAADDNVFEPQFEPTSDPYCTVRLGEKLKQTRVVKKTLDPVWEDAFTFSGQLRWLVQEPCRFEVYDEDLLSSDDLLGAAELDLSPFIHSLAEEGKTRLEKLELEYEGNLQGEIEVEIEANLQVPSWLAVLFNWLGVSALLEPLRQIYNDNTDATITLHLIAGSGLKASDSKLLSTFSRTRRRRIRT